MKKTIFIFTMILSVWTAMALWAGEYPALYESFLIKNDSRARALGEAYTAVEGSAGSLLYNPAGLAVVSDPLFSGSGYLGIAGSSSFSAIGVIPLKAISVAIGVNYFGTPSESIIAIDGTQDGNTKNNSLNIFAGAGRKLNQNLSAGLGIKAVNYSYLTTTQLKFGVDTGIQYKLDKYLLGFSFKDILFAENLNVGGCYQLPQIPLFVTADLSYFLYGQMMVKCGAEYTIAKMINVRAGYKVGADLDALSFGLGVLSPVINGMKISLDYSINPNAESALGQFQTLSIQIGLPSSRANDKLGDEE